LAIFSRLNVGGGLLSKSEELDLLLHCSGDDPVDVDAREVDVHRLDLPDLDDVFGLSTSTSISMEQFGSS
jgi:hypothetical protein